MAWTIRFDPRAERELARLDRQVQIRVLRFLRERIAPLADPKELGEALTGPLRSFWKYRVGSYRVIVDLQHDELVILVVRIGHRGSVYRS
ncbi:MAG TPA: type II toxin-antitoxin system RelE/ParE family toxin [Thermoanaerobaculia bacterium]|nr:type II toxin-antitoxin system RelE/ParE family toxin [Thermoanaerobaculia bacterium]